MKPHRKLSIEQLEPRMPLSGGAPVDIDVGFMIDRSAENALGGLEQAQQFAIQELDTTNSVLKTSQIQAVLHTVGFYTIGIGNLNEAPGMESIAGTMRDTEYVRDPREQFRADLMVLLVDRPDLATPSSSDCGASFIPNAVNVPHAEKAFFAVVNTSCILQGNHVPVPHEIGHALGAAHDEEEEGLRSFPYATAYVGMVQDGTREIWYQTITARYHENTRTIFVLSSPDLKVDITNEQGTLIATAPIGSAMQDNARAVREMAPVVAEHMTPINDAELFIDLGEIVSYPMTSVASRPMKDGRWSVIKGRLPEGLSISLNGVITGTLREMTNPVTVTVQAEDAANGGIHEGKVTIRPRNPLCNPARRADVNDDGIITQEDAERLDAFYTQRGMGPVPVADLPVSAILDDYGFVDVNNDGGITAEDKSSVEATLNNRFHNKIGIGGALDVNGDGHVTPLDALRAINNINENGSVRIANLKQENIDELFSEFGYLDVNDDKALSPLDVLNIINYLNSGTKQ